VPSAAAPTTPIGVLAECDEATKAFLEYLDDQQTEGRKFLHRKLGELDWGEDDKVRVLIEEAYYDFAKKHLRDFFRRNIYENPMRE